MTFGGKYAMVGGMSPRTLNKDKTCSADGCDDPVVVRGLCQVHYSAEHYARPEIKAAIAERRAAYNARPENQAKAKIRASTPEYKAKAKTRAAQGQLAKYGLTQEDYDRMLAEQGGGCAVCGSTDTIKRRLDVDHDHECCPGQKSCGQCVRGLLCSNCNIAIGHLQDDPDLLRAALDYLERYQVSAEVAA